MVRREGQAELSSHHAQASAATFFRLTFSFVWCLYAAPPRKAQKFDNMKLSNFISIYLQEYSELQQIQHMYNHLHYIRNATVCDSFV